MNPRFLSGLLAVLAVAVCSSLAAGCSHSSDTAAAAGSGGGAAVTAATPPPSFNVNSAQAEQAAKNQAVEELKKKVQQGQVK